jgi:hypothetical protein
MCDWLQERLLTLREEAAACRQIQSRKQYCGGLTTTFCDFKIPI